MFKESVPIATLCLCMMAWAPATMAQSEKPACAQLTPEIQSAQDKIDKTRRAYDQSAKVLDKRMALANADAEKRENMDTLWADVLSSREVVLPRANAALTALNAGYALMQNYVSAGCNETTSSELEDRRSRGASRYEKSITALQNIPTDWHKQYDPVIPPDPAECIALDEAHKNAQAKAKAYSLKNDVKIAAYNAARQAVNNAIDLERPFSKEWRALLKTRKNALPATEGYTKLLDAVYDPVKLGIKNSCVQMDQKQLKAFKDNAYVIFDEISDSYSSMLNMPLKAKKYTEKRRKTTTPRVGIINKTDQILCYHLNGTAKGKCVIKPGGTRIVELRQDVKGKPESTMLITGGISWEKDADGTAQVKDMQICAKRTFDQQSGSKAWAIKPGIEDGCSYPAIEEEKGK